jgi:signal transduction histidine kinase
LSITFFVSFSLSFVAFSYFSSLKLSDALVLTSLFTLCTAFFFQKFWFHFSLTSPLHIALESFLKESVLLSSFDDLQRKIDEIFGVRLGYARHQLVLVEEMTMSSYLEPLSSRIEHILEKIPETCFSETDVFVFPFLDSEEKEVLSHFFTRLHIEYLSLLLVDEKIVGIFGFTPSLSFSVAEKKSIELFSQRLSVLLFSLSLQEKQADTMKILQSVIDEKTEKLQEHIEQQNTLYNEQNNFLALTAHEFRTPLSIALFQVQDILSQEGVPNNLKEDLSLIEESLENLKTLTQNLFDVQKFDLETTEIVFTPLPLSSVLSDIFSAFSSAVKEKNITIVKEQDEDLFRFSVFGESSYIMQAVLNVFGNALKFSPKNSQMKVGAKKDGDFLVLEIHDSGPGISEENQKILFNKFQKGNTKKSGMGLGLYIAKKVCEKHGGGISVASSSSLSGAVFTLSFPIVPVKNVENSEETY